MKHYLVIVLIGMYLINSNLYVIDSFKTHQHVHKHSHSLSSSSHSHTHTHSQAAINLADFFIPTPDSNRVVILYSKESHAETTFFISDPTLESLFRPPIV